MGQIRPEFLRKNGTRPNSDEPDMMQRRFPSFSNIDVSDEWMKMGGFPPLGNSHHDDLGT